MGERDPGEVSKIVGKSLEQARLVQAAFQAKYFKLEGYDPNVSPVHGVGLRPTITRTGSTRFAIAVMVSEDFRERGKFPIRSFRGIPVEYLTNGPSILA